VILAGYLISLLLRTDSQYWTWLDGWMVVGVELVASALCMARALVDRPGRGAAFVLGLSLLSWTIGDVIVTVESFGGATPPSSSPSTIFYLAFYPLAYVAIVLFMRGLVSGLTRAAWLDGAIAGLGAAAACAAFAFHGLLFTAGADTVATVADLALPIGDALLLGFVVGGFAVLSGRRRVPWILLATGLTLNVLGDTANLLPHSFGATRFGFIINAIAWPSAIVLMSMAVWVRQRRSNPLLPPRQPGFLLPILAAAAALTVLFVGTLISVGRLAVAMATATLLVVGIRLLLSVQDLEALSQERHRQSVTDELTGLWNRRYLFRVLDTFFAEDSDAPTDRMLAFLFVDLDRFKEVNDSFGHSAGDELLRQLGARMQGSLRDTDLLVRLGGDEFAVVLIGGDAAYGREVAERLTASLAESFTLDVVSTSIGASIGIAVAPAHATDSARLVWCADTAMYRAKVAGVPIASFDQRIDEEKDQMRLAEELQAAVDQDHLVLYYQPQLDLRSGAVESCEALIRWRHPRLGLLSPDRFLPLAEEAGLMGAVTDWVLDSALAQCARWRSDGRPVSVSVNISASNLVQPLFADAVRRQLSHHGLPGEALVLEITETSVISEFETSRRVIQELADLGPVVSIDDFGAGATSLAYLSNLAVRELKLDRTFLTGIVDGDRARERELVRSTIELGHAMGLRIVAEGIEDADTLDLLTRFGCDIAQGFFIARPQPVAAIAFHGAAEPRTATAR
jgi:diguanylate cyclase (GGDEF)-like protein